MWNTIAVVISVIILSIIVYLLTKSNTKNVNTPTIYGATKVTDKLYIGDANTASSREFMEKFNIGRVVNVAIGVPFYFLNDELLNIDYLKGVQIHDDGKTNLYQYYKSIFDFINTSPRNVLIHCVKGRSRSASFVIAYLMYNNKWTFEKAYDYLRNIRPIIHPRQGFIAQLRNL